MKKSLFFFLVSQLSISLVCSIVIITHDDLGFWLSASLYALSWLALLSFAINYVVQTKPGNSNAEIADKKLGEWARAVSKNIKYSKIIKD